MVESHGIHINAFPPLQYSLDCPHLNMTKVEKNRVIRTDLNRIKWISPTTSLHTKMAHYKAHFAHRSEDGFIIRSSNIHIHLSYALHSVIWQLQTSSHKLKIEVGIYAQIPLEERIC